MAQASRLAKDLTLKGTTATIPRLVYGTAWKAEKTADLVYAALKSGFRGIDTAAQPKHYNEGGVGQGVRKAVKDGIIKREDLFVRTVIIDMLIRTRINQDRFKLSSLRQVLKTTIHPTILMHPGPTRFISL